ncbi:MAG: aminotransferase class I/II-fold pyridoxal phosphate-dependent enzyme [Alphaproteobacteria bacterium]|nr:aminotransferase class I/II-fold pyridoxal phosphate-dependent enzyme [Alphaproteobacteria bacterium]
MMTRPLPKARLLSNNEEYINFCSSDYLGLSTHPRIKKAMQLSMETNGFGSTSSPLLSGYSVECEELKKAFCQRLGFEDGLLFPSGYQANIGALSALLTRNSTALCDRLCHASIIDGLILSRARIKRFRHNDIHQAHEFVKVSPPDLLITESVFSMEGDMAPIDEMSSLCHSHSTPFFVDDAHGFGIMDHWKTRAKKPNILSISFGKTLGLSGGIILASNHIINLLLQYSRSYRYSIAISPVICVGVLESLDVLLKEKWRLETLKQRISLFNTYAMEYKLPLISQDITPIRSIRIGDSHKTSAVAKYLKNKGIYVAAIRPPTVPEHTSRLRISLSSSHETSDIQYLAHSIREALQ